MKPYLLLSLLVLMPMLQAQEVLPPVPMPMQRSTTLADPFAAQVIPELPPVPASKVQEPPAGLPATIQPIPANLRVALFREHGQAILSTTDAGSLSILVNHGKNVRIAGQAYFAEVVDNVVRLYLDKNGRLIWEGGLASMVLPSVPPDLSQARFVPPLSAGVNPGLRSQSGSTTGANTLPNSSQNSHNMTNVIQPQGVR